MELVYLWVEEYKNIHRQGFNFSPKFNCDYDEKTNKLTIDDNPNYIENFFGDNINVTAIVGKNGSGKSSLLELIFDRSYENPLVSPNPIGYYDVNQIIIYYNQETNEIFIYTDINQLLILNNSLAIDEKKSCEDQHTQQTYAYSPHAPIFEDVYIQKIHIQSTPSRSQEEYILLLDFLRNNKIYFPFKIPKFVKFSLHDECYDLIKGDNFDYSLYDEDNWLKKLHILLLLALMENHSIGSDLNLLKDYEETIFKLKEQINDNFGVNDIVNGIDNFIVVFKNRLEEFSQNPNYYLCMNNIPNNFFNIYRNILTRVGGMESFDFEGKNVFNLELYPKMSDGQYQLTYLYNMIYSKIEKKNILLLIDEGENYLHPNWQKKYISYIIKFIKDNFRNKKIQIIFTTHSPFLLSDIPKQNIIFLDKDTEGKCIIVDGLKDKKQTFGANIHTLLSDSFFMEDGLMGEFSKGKINEIIDFHKEVEKSKDNESDKNTLRTKYEIEEDSKPSVKTKFWDIQSIIGEDYLKQVIRNHLVEIEKILLGKDIAKKEEITRTKKYLKSLEDE